MVSLEHYEVSILGAADSSALMNWLEKNGHHVNPGAGAVLDSTIARRWAFVAVKLNPSEKRHYQNEFLPPLTIRYRHAASLWTLLRSWLWSRKIGELIFPLRISSLSTATSVKTARLEYEPIIPRDSDPERYLEDRIIATIGTEHRGLVVLWSGECNSEIMNLSCPLRKKPFPRDATIFLTRLEMRMDRAAMTEDIALELDQFPKEFPVRIEAE